MKLLVCAFHERYTEGWDRAYGKYVLFEHKCVAEECRFARRRNLTRCIFQDVGSNSLRPSYQDQAARNNILRFACTTIRYVRNVSQKSAEKSLNNTQNTDDQQEFIRARNPRTWGKPSPVEDQGFTTHSGGPLVTNVNLASRLIKPYFVSPHQQH